MMITLHPYLRQYTFFLACTVFYSCYLPSALPAQTYGQNYSVLLTVETSESPLYIKLLWNTVENVTSYYIERRTDTNGEWTKLPDAWQLDTSTTSYTDTDVALGAVYEYRVVAKRSTYPYNALGYVSAAIKLPVLEDRGTIALVVDDTFTADLSTELAELTMDLTGDGWNVVQIDVNRSSTPAEVKAAILSVATANPELNALYLIGHVPVPYSGTMAPDLHYDHFGAWPSDGYYGDLDGIWTDSTVNYNANNERNTNIPADGKFDQTYFPSDIELQIGRVDFADLSAHTLDEKALLKQYLQKAHDYKHGNIIVTSQAIVDDNFQNLSEGLSSTAWRGFSPLVGKDNISAGDFFTSTTNDSYLWGYGAGPGTYSSATGVGTSQDFIDQEVNCIFTAFMGSYFGEWDTENNFLRMALTSGNILTTTWSGRPHYYFQHMGLGEPIGYGARLSMNNSGNTSTAYYPTGAYAQETHMALFGDPSLRLHTVSPPQQLTATVIDDDVKIQWSSSGDPGVLGYYVYKSSASNGSYERISAAIISGNSFTDQCITAGTHYYMVRSVKLEESHSGSYHNLSQGIFTSAYRDRNCDGSILSLPLELLSFSAELDADRDVLLNWITTTEINVSHFEMQKRSRSNQWEKIGRVTATGNSIEEELYSFIDEAPGAGHHYYRLKMVDLDQSYEYSPVATITLTPVDIKVFPNPAGNNLRIAFPATNGAGSLQQVHIMDATGRIVRKMHPVNQSEILQVNISALPTGVYYISVVTNSGNAVQKLIISR